MALVYKRGEKWWIASTVDGKRIQKPLPGVTRKANASSTFGC